MPLFTLAELRLAADDADLTTEQYNLILERVTAKVTARAPRAFIVQGAHTIRRQVVGGKVTLPRPVDSVESVTEVDEDGAATIDRAFTWDGIDRLGLLCDGSVVEVDYTGGFVSVPADVKDVALSVAARMASNPRGTRQTAETIGSYSTSETFAGSDGDVAGSELLASELRALRPYRLAAGTTRLS